ncbi:MAG TPA: AAA family ATPase, partial [Bacteroidia bacterium]|nr:AAA family ATPase [Bacteroidia bacterium]
MEIKQTEEFDLAYRFITETNQNVFLTGKAGTGKTTFLKFLRQNSLKNMVVAAPTGVAAINAGGVTLHSLFHLPFAPYIPSKDSANADAVNSHSLLSQIHYNKTKLDLLRNLELLVIDEVSMVASHTIDAIDTILRSVRRRYHEPFGGTQVLFIGDLHQLPPVIKREEWEFLKNYYQSIFFFDSLVLREHVPVMVELKKIFRQQDDAFIEILNGVRNNTLELEHFELLNSRYRKDFIPDDDKGFITLTTHNYQSDAINKGKLKALDSPMYSYRAVVEGNFPEHMYPAESDLELKEGAQVMFLKNDTEEKKYFNGKIGTITYLDRETIKVLCKGEEHEIAVQKYEWKNTNYSLNADTRQIEEEELGSFQQYPLRLAWAITIHKSQGLTFDKLIIDAENAFANGQVYVALSRCTSLEGLVLTSHINQRFLGAHQNLTEWTAKNSTYNNLEQRFYEARQSFILQELQNIFSWKNWYYELKDLQTAMQENKESFTVENFQWVEKLSQEQVLLDEVAGKFKGFIQGAYNQNPDIENNEPLQKRIKDAANYFV